jgi:phosphate transport system substrate-binding protein
MKITKAFFILASLLLGSTTSYAQDITGAGSTFAGPIYMKWADALKTRGIKLNYQGIGSGGGINQVINRTVDFGGTDMPLSAEKLAEARLAQFPTVIGGVVVIVNLPDIATNQLRLTGPILANIYLGKIRKWNDPAIASINPGIALPNMAIATIHRADGSGTTFVFTNYLSGQSTDWQTAIGNSTSVNWPGGFGAKGNDGVSSSVRQVKGSIGYVESAYASLNKLVTTQMMNRDGKFVSPTLETFSAAAANADWTNAVNFAVNLNNQKGAESWPIESATFVLLPLDPKDMNVSKAVREFFDVSFATGSETAMNMQYVPLPISVQNAVRAAWRTQFNR